MQRRQRRVLWCWELGGGMGHLSRIHSQSRCLVHRGDEVWFAVKDVTRTGNLFDPATVILQAPTWHAHASGLMPAVNYAALLAHQGWLSADYLVPRVRCWIRLFELSKCEVVLIDHAPTALLAAKIAGLPTIRAGNGFEAPPELSPYPLFLPQQRDVSELVTLQQSISEQCKLVVQRIASPEVMANLNLPLEKLLRPTKELIAGTAAFDHYATAATGRDGVTYIGQDTESLTSAKNTIHWPPQEVHLPAPSNVFVYLNPEQPSFDKVLHALEQLKCNVIVYAPGAMLSVLENRFGKSIRFSTAPVNLSTLLPNADLVICHSANGTGAMSWAHGVPFIAVPTQAEQYMAASRAVDAGGCAMLPPKMEFPEVFQFISTALQNQKLKLAAKTLSNDPLLQKLEISKLLDAVDEVIST